MVVITLTNTLNRMKNKTKPRMLVPIHPDVVIHPSSQQVSQSFHQPVSQPLIHVAILSVIYVTYSFFSSVRRAILTAATVSNIKQESINGGKANVLSTFLISTVMAL